jgi:flagellar basal body-associated protein FliL
MADTDEIKQQEQQETQEVQEKKEDKKPEAGKKKSLLTRLLPKVIIVVVVVIFAGTGFTLGRLFTGSSTSQTSGASEDGQSPDLGNLKAKGSKDDSQKNWYYHLEPVIANLNVTDVTRYVKASLTLEVSFEVDEKKGKIFLDENKPVLINWLHVYLANLGLEDIRGKSNLKRIQSQILDAFNEQLFPDSKPEIKQVLLKDFAVQ